MWKGDPAEARIPEKSEEYAQKLVDLQPESPSITVRFSDLKNFMEAWPQIEIKAVEKCYECKGEGVVECECCGHEKDCDACRGKGEIKTGRVEGHEPDPSIVADLNGWMRLGLHTLPLIAEILGLLNSDLKITKVDPRGPCLVELPEGMRLVVMPVMTDKGLPLKTI